LAICDGIRGTEPGTQRQYDLAFERWRLFLDGRRQPEVVYFQNIPRQVQVVLLQVFATWIREHTKLQSITGTFSGVRNALVRVGARVDAFEDPNVGLARKHFRKASRESSENLVQRAPVCGQFIVYIKAEMIRIREAPRVTVAVKLKAMCTYLASVFMWNFGTRFCNVGGNPENSDKHAIRLKDVTFEVDGEMLCVDEFWVFVRDQQWDPLAHRDAIVNSVSCLVVILHSSKVWKAAGRTEVLERGVSGSEGDFFFAALVMWLVSDSGRSCQPGRYRPDDLLFGTEHSKVTVSGIMVYTRVLQRKDMTEAVKTAARSLKLDPAVFSVYSLRIGAATQMTGCGVPQEAISRMLDHAPNSESTQIYQRTTGHETRPLMRPIDDGFSLEDIRRVHDRRRRGPSMPVTERGIESPVECDRSLDDLHRVPGRLGTSEDTIADIPSPPPEETGALAPPTRDGYSPEERALAADMGWRYPSYEAGSTSDVLDILLEVQDSPPMSATERFLAHLDEYDRSLNECNCSLDTCIVCQNQRGVDAWLENFYNRTEGPVDDGYRPMPPLPPQRKNSDGEDNVRG
jgi:hypothetical protein